MPVPSNQLPVTCCPCCCETCRRLGPPPLFGPMAAAQGRPVRAGQGRPVGGGVPHRVDNRQSTADTNGELHRSTRRITRLIAQFDIG